MSNSKLYPGGQAIFLKGSGLDDAREFEDFDLFGTFEPVVTPADDQVAAGFGVAVSAEVLAFELELDADALPAAGSDLAQGFAIGETGLHVVHDVAEISCEKTEQEDDALFVERFMPQPTESSGSAVGQPAGSRSVTRFARGEGRRGGEAVWTLVSL